MSLRFIPVNFTKCFRTPTAYFSLSAPDRGIPKTLANNTGFTAVLHFNIGGCFQGLSSDFKLKKYMFFPNYWKDFLGKNVISRTFLD